MTEQQAKHYSLSETAIAAGVEWSRIRNWLDRSQIRVDADSDRVEMSKHRRFSFLDVVRIGIIGRLVRHGLNAETASKLTETYIGWFTKHKDAKIRRFYSSPKTAPNLIASSLSARMLAVWYLEEKDAWMIQAVDDFQIENFDWLQKLREESDHSFTLVDVGGIAKIALERLQGNAE